MYIRTGRLLWMINASNGKIFGMEVTEMNGFFVNISCRTNNMGDFQKILETCTVHSCQSLHKNRPNLMYI